MFSLEHKDDNKLKACAAISTCKRFLSILDLMESRDSSPLAGKASKWSQEAIAR